MKTIFHLTLESQWRAGVSDGRYTPPGFAREGFLHAAGDRAVAEEVASSYFAKAAEPVLWLELMVEGLDVRWEPPAPPSGTAQKHHVPGRLFPHVYEAIPLTAIVARGRLERGGDAWTWVVVGA